MAKAKAQRRRKENTPVALPREPADMTAAEAAAAVRSGAITSEALVLACLNRIGAADGELRAWAFLDRDDALERARYADRVIAKGFGSGPLHGVPVGIKDIIDVAGMPTECGSPLFRGFRPEQNAPVVAALEAAGAVVIGKTVTTELATLTPSPTRNPRNLAHTPGGSSSGSAAAVAAGMVPLALGTQTAGSVIRPASFCGIYGYKPTFGLIPRRGVLLQSHTLDTVGVFARTIDDIALIANTVCRHDPDDRYSARHARPDFVALAAEAPPEEPRLALVKTPAWEETDAITREAFAEFAAELGASLSEVDIPGLGEGVEAQRTVQRCENASYYGAFARRAPELISAQLLEHIKNGTRVPARDYIDAVRLREMVYANLLRSLEGFAAIVTPAAPGPAPSDHLTTGNPIFNGVWTWLGVPAITLPLLEADGLPIGVQLVGRRHDDARLMRTARWLVARLAG
jgi:Asp-tRNA(Asn)/Glu-tRNA(Gln) amidotransferase A subunit family amidase